MWKLGLGAGVWLALIGCNKNNNYIVDTDVGDDGEDTEDTRDTEDTEDTEDTVDTSEDTERDTADTETDDTRDTEETGDSSVDTIDTWWVDTWTRDSGRDSGRRVDTGITFSWAGSGTVSSSKYSGAETFTATSKWTGSPECVYAWSAVSGTPASSSISVDCEDAGGNACDFAFAIKRGSGGATSGCGAGVPRVATAITGWGYLSSYEYVSYGYSYSLGPALMAYYDSSGSWFMAALPYYGYGTASTSGTRFTYETIEFSYY